MSGELHGACLVDVDMRRVAADDALVGLEHAIDDGGVGLRAAGEEVNLRVGSLASLADELAGMLAVAVVAIALRTLAVGGDEMAKHGVVGSVVVVAFEMYQVHDVSV